VAGLRSRGEGAAAGTNGAATLGAPAVVSERYDTTDSLIIQSTTVTGNAGAQALTGLTVGSRGNGAPFCPIKIFGIIIRAQMSAGQLADSQGYLKALSGAA
jgi:hypothetical protein